MSRRDAAVRYVRTNLEEPLILASLGKMAFSGTDNLSDTDQAVLAAFRRSRNDLGDASPEEISAYLRDRDEAALSGIVSNTKGILHEMRFVEVENEDGDSIYASFFGDTNHPATDVQFIDTETGHTWEVQLKATDSASYANDWVENHPGGEILVTTELSDRTGLESSGFSNDELTGDVEHFVDRMIAGDPGIWDHFPIVATLTLANILWALCERYQNGDIDWERFKYLAARASGIKVTKIALLSALLAVPVVGQATGALLIAQFLLGARDALRSAADERSARGGAVLRALPTT